MRTRVAASEIHRMLKKTVSETSWPAYPFPAMPPEFARQRFTVADINPYIDSAVYEVNGREYIAFAARTGRLFDNIGSESIVWKKGRTEAQACYVLSVK